MRARRILAPALVLLLAACGEGPVSPTISSGSGSGPAPVNLAGSWTGSATDAAGSFRMAWQLTQTGRTVTGTVSGTTPVGAPLYSNGTFQGTLLGTTLTFTITIPRGGIAGAPDCSLTVSGTAQEVTASGVTGTYTGTDSCLGGIADGRLAMVRQ